MWISEVFHSVQGEGRYTGVDSGFIRTSGCNLRCCFCDTPYTSWQPEGTERSLQSLVDEILDYACPHVVLTGGEPLLLPDIVPLSERLHAAGLFITVETAGTIYRPVVADLMSISPKLLNSVPVGTAWEERHAQRRDRPAVIQHLLDNYNVQFKFVVDQPEDVAEVERYLMDHPGIRNDDIYLMPQGIVLDELQQKMRWVTAAAEERGWQTSPRKHIELFGNTRGT